jgi:hypothetical protein
MWLHTLLQRMFRLQEKLPPLQELFKREIPNFFPFWGISFGLPGLGSVSETLRIANFYFLSRSLLLFV